MDGMNKLFQLKYLSFRGTRISDSKLPSGIVMLHDLETLDLRDTCIQELPAGIVQLIKLQPLLTVRRNEEGQSKIPNGIANMRNLQVISGFNITMSSVGAVEELGYLNSLNELHVQFNGGGSDEYKRHEEMLLSSLCKLGTCKLQSLWIYSHDSTPLELLEFLYPLPSSLQIFHMNTSYYLQKTPKWIAPALTSLAYLNIKLTEVTDGEMCTLGKLHALLSLELWLQADPKERFTIQGFPSLTEFILNCREGNRGAYLTLVKGAMPKVEKLVLPFHVLMATTYDFCFGIRHLPYLKIALVHLYREGAGYSESMAAAAVIKNEACVHPSHPRVIIVGETDIDEKKSMEDGDTDDN